MAFRLNEYKGKLDFIRENVVYMLTAVVQCDAC